MGAGPLGRRLQLGAGEPRGALIWCRESEALERGGSRLAIPQTANPLLLSRVEARLDLRSGVGAAGTLARLCFKAITELRASPFPGAESIDGVVLAVEERLDALIAWLVEHVSQRVLKRRDRFHVWARRGVGLGDHVEMGSEPAETLSNFHPQIFSPRDTARNRGGRACGQRVA